MGMYFKLFGLRYSNPHGLPNLDDKNYLSNLQFARTGDVLVDENGNILSVGVIGISYGVPPEPYDMQPEETSLWFNLATNSVWSRTLLSDGITLVDVDTGPLGQGDMLKAVYDTNDDGIVDAADQLATSTISVSATEARNHIDNPAIHRSMNDAITTNANLWSAQKITTEIIAATPLFSVDVNGMVGAPTAVQAASSDYFLRADNTWHELAIADFDLNVYDLQPGDMLVYGADSHWWNVHPGVGTGLHLELTFGESSEDSTLVLYNTLTLDEARLNGDRLHGPVYYDEYVPIDDPFQLVPKYYVDVTNSLAGLSDVTISSPAASNLLVYNGVKWLNTAIQTVGNITVSYDGMTLLFDVPIITEAHNELSGLQGGSASDSEYYHITEAQYTELSTFFNLPAGGLLVHKLDDSYVIRSLAVASNKLSLVNANGETGNPTLDVVESNLSILNIPGVLPWARVSKVGSLLDDLGDVNSDYAAASDLLMYTGVEWKHTPLYTSGAIIATYDGSSLLLDVPAGIIPHNSLMGLQGGSESGSEYYHLDLDTYASVISGGWVAVPASSSSSGEMGQRAYDNRYLYLCVGLNEWVRAPVEWTF